MIRRLILAWLAMAATLAAVMVCGGWRRDRAEQARRQGIHDVCRDIGCRGLST